jgi:uncharacterized Zn finger protein
MDVKKWPCPSCGANLGNISNGELVVDKDAAANVNTQGINLVLVCIKCGRVKVWFAKPKDQKVNFIDMLEEEIAQKVVSIMEERDERRVS